MLPTLQRIRRLCRRREDEEGASAVEYALLVGAIAAVIATVVFTLGGQVHDMFVDGCTSFDSGGGTSTC